MSVKLTWVPDFSVPITNFVITKSTDKGAVYTTLVTITFDTQGANFDKTNKQFFYTDGAGNPGDVYRIQVNGALGSSVLEYAVSPPGPQAMCLIIGYLVDAFGQADQKNAVHVDVFGGRSREESWMSGQGLMSQNPSSLGVVESTVQVTPDENGMWQISLLQGAFAKVYIPALNWQWVFEVPKKSGPINIRDISQMRGAAHGVFPEMSGTPQQFPRG